MRVCDISKHQGTFNATQAKSAGVERIIVRAMHGVAGEDNQYKNFATWSKAANLSVGSYYFANYIHGKYNNSDVNQARRLMRKEVEYFISLLEREHITGWAAIDQENESSYGRYMSLNKHDNTMLLNEAGTMLEQAGFHPCLYCSASWISSFVDTNLLNMPIWAAWYFNNPNDPDFSPDLDSLTGSYAKQLQELKAHGKLCGWQFGRIGYGTKYGVGSVNIDRNVFYTWPGESEDKPMEFKPLENKQLVCITDHNPSCEVFSTWDVNSSIGKLGKDTVYPVIGVGASETISGIPGTWYSIEYQPERYDCAYVWVTPDRARIEDAPIEPPKPVDPVNKMTITGLSYADSLIIEGLATKFGAKVKNEVK